MTAIVTRGDAANLLLPDETVDLVVTSPPYHQLRAYQDGGVAYDGQIGAEETPEQYLDALVACTREWARVLKGSGSLFVNLGDAYANKGLRGLPWRYAIRCIDELGLILRAEIVWAKPNGLPESVTDRVRRSHEQVFHFVKQPRYFSGVDEIREEHIAEDHHRNVKQYQMTHAPGQPAVKMDRTLRNPLGKLPGSVWTIPTSPLKVPASLGIDHFAAYPLELVRRIVLGWSPREVCTACGEGRRPVIASVGLDMGRPQARRAQQLADRAGLTEDHLAALLSVGVSDTGRGKATQSGTGKNRPEVYALADEARAALGGYAREYLLRRPTGLTTACACPEPAPNLEGEVRGRSGGERSSAGVPEHASRSQSPRYLPGVVLDPFGGTGTTALVASAHGRVGISVDLSADYCRLARWRTTDPGERARVLGVEKPPVQVEGQQDLFGELTA